MKRPSWPVVRLIGSLSAALVVLVLLIAWLAGAFTKKVPPVEEPVRGRLVAGQPVGMVHEVTKQYIEEAIGTLKAASRTVISAKVLATIKQIYVNAGDEVTAGQGLVELESKELEARLRQAEQALKAAEAARVKAEADFKRIEQLRKRSPGIITQDEYDDAVAKLQIARADEARAQQAVTEAEVLLSYATILAPKSGRIVDRFAEPGDTARPGVPLLVLYDARSLRLEAPVMENLAIKLRVGQTVPVYIDALERQYEATIDEIVPQAEAPSRSFLVKAALPKADDLYEGMFGRLRIPAGERRHLCLPTAAIQQIGQLDFVEVVLPDQTTERRFITLGTLGMPGRIEVLSGVEAGERVVLHSDSSQSTDQSIPAPEPYTDVQ